MRVPRFLVNIRHQRRQDNYTRTGFVSFFLSLRNTNIAFHARWKCWLISDTIVSKKKKKEINYSASYSVFLLIEWSERQIWIDYNNGFRVSFFFLFKLRNMSKINVIGEIKIDKNCQNLDRSKRHFSFLWYTESMGKEANNSKLDETQFWNCRFVARRIFIRPFNPKPQSITVIDDTCKYDCKSSLDRRINILKLSRNNFF